MATRADRMAGATGAADAGTTRWLIAAAGVLIQIALGAIYGWSVFVKPLQTLDHASKTEVNLTFSIALVVLGFAAFFGGLWMARVGPRVVGVTAGVLYGLGVFLSSFTAHSIPLLYLTYGVLGGIGLGFGYIVPIATLVKWFPDKRGLITGIAVAGFGGGAIVTALIAPGLIKAQGVPRTFAILGVAYLILVVVGALFMRNPAEGYRPMGWTPAQAARGADADFTLGAALKRWQWYALWALLFLNVIPGAAIISVASPMAQDIAKVTAAAAAGLVILNSVANAAGRFVWAWFSDAIGRKYVFLCLFLVEAVVLFIMPQAHTFGFLSVLSMIVILCYGGGFGTMPAFAADYFGPRFVGPIYGLMLTAWGAGGIVGPLLISSIRDSTRSYNNALYIFAAIVLVSAIIPFIVRPPVAPQGVETSAARGAARTAPTT